jgi:bacteriorhodopsin
VVSKGIVEVFTFELLLLLQSIFSKSKGRVGVFKVELVLVGFFSGVLYLTCSDNLGLENVQSKLRGGKDVGSLSLRNGMLPVN